MKPILIFGAGQVAQVFAEFILPHGFIVDESYLPQPADYDNNEGYRSLVDRLGEHVYCPPLSDKWFLPRKYSFVIGMSFKGLNKPRAEKFEMMRAKGYAPLTYRHPDIWKPRSALIGAGSFIMDRNTIQTGVEIGENVIAWSGSHFGHHCKIGNHVFVASHAVISGGVEIGDFSFVGVNATIADGVKIGRDCIIGAGANIVSDCEDGGVYPGPRTERSKVPSSRMGGVWARR